MVTIIAVLFLLWSLSPFLSYLWRTRRTDAGVEGLALRRRAGVVGRPRGDVTEEITRKRAEALPEPSLIAESDDADDNSGINGNGGTGNYAVMEPQSLAGSATRQMVEQARASVTFPAETNKALVTRAGDAVDKWFDLGPGSLVQGIDDVSKDGTAAVSRGNGREGGSINEREAGQNGEMGDFGDVDASCGMALNTDYDGDAVTWGMSHRQPSAAECCAACKAHARCNIWVWCPLPVCWSADIWNHTQHECWLKVQPDPEHPRVNMQGKYPPAFKAEHKTAPDMVPWIGGVLLPSKSKS